MRKPFIAGNWKLNKNIAEARAFAEAFAPMVDGVEDVEIGIGVQFVALKSLVDAFAGSKVKVGAQDCYWEESGAFTGEIAPAMILDAGAAFVIIGHSERRQYFGETNETVNKKIFAALEAGLEVIMCCGETLEEREADKTNMVVKDHLVNGLAGLAPGQMNKITIAYEPVWAIGTGKTATPEQAQEVHAYLRELLERTFGRETAQTTRIQYGGSVKPANVRELMAKPDIDGALVGGASLEPESFAEIVKFNS